MANNSTATGIDELDLNDALDEGYDPLADIDFADDEDVDYPVGDGANLKQAGLPEVEPVPAHDARPASERTAELFSRMATRRKTLLAILRKCQEKQPVRDVVDYICDLKSSHVLNS